MLDPQRFSRDVLAALPADERLTRLGELEAAANAELAGPLSMLVRRRDTRL